MPSENKKNIEPLSKEWFNFTDEVPDNIRATAELICNTYNIHGDNAPMNIANHLAYAVGLGNGRGGFESFHKNIDKHDFTCAANVICLDFVVGSDPIIDIAKLSAKSLGFSDISFPVSSYNSESDEISDDDLESASDMYDRLKNKTDPYSVVTKILEEKYHITIAASAIDEIISEFACSRLSMDEIINVRSLNGFLDKHNVLNEIVLDDVNDSPRP